MSRRGWKGRRCDRWDAGKESARRRLTSDARGAARQNHNS